MERREYTRIACNVGSGLRLPDDTWVPGVTQDISFGGAYHDCAPELRASEIPLTTHDECVLELHLDQRQGGAKAAIRCLVADTQGRRIGLRFLDAAYDDYEALRRFLLDNAPDSAALLEEMRVFPNPAFSRDFHLPGFTHWIKRMLQRIQTARVA